MRITSAERILAPLATVERRGDEYHATLTETGEVITFREVRGRVAGVRLVRPTGRPWGYRALTTAIRHGLIRSRLIHGEGRMLSASVQRRGRALEPVASFMMVLNVAGQRYPDVRGWGWADPEALGMAESVIAGQAAMPAALDWLRARGVEVE